MLGAHACVRTATNDRYAYSGSLLSSIERNITLSEEFVVKNVNNDADGGWPRGRPGRVIEFDDQGRMYVSVGSVENVDASSFRSRIRRFDVSGATAIPDGGFEFTTGEVFADGLRNTLGLAFDKTGTLWGVENRCALFAVCRGHGRRARGGQSVAQRGTGKRARRRRTRPVPLSFFPCAFSVRSADDLDRSDLGGDIHVSNPAEELNRFPEANAGKHYGYPYCFTQQVLDEKVTSERVSE